MTIPQVPQSAPGCGAAPPPSSARTMEEGDSEVAALLQELREQLGRARPDSSAVLTVGQKLALLLQRQAERPTPKAPAASPELSVDKTQDRPAAPAVPSPAAWLAEGAAPTPDLATSDNRGAQGPRASAASADGPEWVRRSLGLSASQVRKYLRVARTFCSAEVAGHHLGVESLSQIALADARLRPLLWRLAIDEHLSSGALCAGRRAGGRALHGGDLEAAHQATETAARRHAQREEQTAPPPAVRPPGDALTPALDRARQQIEATLQAATLPQSPAELTRLRERLATLEALCARLHQRLTAATSALGDAAEAAPPPPTSPRRAAAAAATPQPAEPTPPRVDPAPGAAGPGGEDAASRGDSVGDRSSAAERTGPALAELNALAQTAAEVAPMQAWLSALPPARRDLLVKLLTGVLVGRASLAQLKEVLDERMPYWELAEPPPPELSTWRSALLRSSSRALTALSTLAAVDPVQLLYVLPALLDRLNDPAEVERCALGPASAVLLRLAARHGAIVAHLREAHPRSGAARREEETA